MRPGPIFAAAIVLLPTIALAADSVQMTAGRWVETFTTTSANIAGKAVPAAQLGEAVSKPVCMSPAEAADARTFFQSRGGGGSNCADPTGTVGSGKLALVSTCRQDGGAPVVLEVKGDYGAATYNAAIRAQSGAAPSQTVVTMTVTGRYEGACRGDEGQ
jgi:hypothetical protein